MMIGVALKEESPMLTIDQIFEFVERVIAEDRLSGNRAGLKNTQIAAGFLMAAASYAGDKESARRFHILAAEAANKNEELSGED
jgi:hypothetical protein